MSGWLPYPYSRSRKGSIRSYPTVATMEPTSRLSRRARGIPKSMHRGPQAWTQRWQGR